jgi:phosphatidylserine decarboxylase
LLLGINIYFSLVNEAYSSSSWAVSGLIIIIWLGIAAFFRDPKRNIPHEKDILVSPADGVIRDIELIKNCEINCFEGKDTLRIGIFLSVLDVHLNRTPCDMHVEFEQYKKGKFHDARNTNASKENESMTIAGTAYVEGEEFPIAIKQISGAIARRIVCPVKIGDFFAKGQIYGMIKFGSRTELYLPASQDVQVQVKVGDRVFAGSSIVAKKVDLDDAELENDNKDEESRETQ